MDNHSSRIMYLEYIEELPGSSIYIITYPGALTPQTQRIMFKYSDNSVEFIKPLSEHYYFLKENEKWLKKILSVTSKTEKKSGFKIPFTFPSAEPCRLAPHNAIKVYCDGSCSAEGIGGWASVILKPCGSIIEMSGREENSTSNCMELMAAFKALEKSAELLPVYKSESMILLTDSMYVIKGITHRFGI